MIEVCLHSPRTKNVCRFGSSRWKQIQQSGVGICDGDGDEGFKKHMIFYVMVGCLLLLLLSGLVY